MIASNNDGLWNEKGASFAFAIQPYFYQTRWFYLVLGTAFAAGLPQGMTLEEVLSFLSAEDDVDQRQVLDAVAQRLGEAPVAGQAQQRRIRILTTQRQGRIHSVRRTGRHPEL